MTESRDEPYEALAFEQPLRNGEPAIGPNQLLCVDRRDLNGPSNLADHFKRRFDDSRPLLGQASIEALDELANKECRRVVLLMCLYDSHEYVA